MSRGYPIFSRIASVCLLSQIGIIYSQLRIGQSTGHVADYSRIAEDVDEEVRQLEDYLDALNEVKLG